MSVVRGANVETIGRWPSPNSTAAITLADHKIVEVGVPHYPRTAGSPTGAKPSVIWRAVKDFWALRLRLWVNRERALRRGRPILGSDAAAASDAAWLPPLR